MHYFSLHHDGKGLWEFLNLTENNPSASMYNFCYKDVSNDNGEYISLFIHYFDYLYIYFTFFKPNMK